MKRANSKSKIITTMFLVALLAVPSLAGAGYSQRNFTSVDEPITLRSGWVSSCQGDFVVENMGNDQARILIQLGIEEFKTEVIPKWEKRAYDLRHDLTLAKQLGKSVHINDVAQVKNISEESEVKIYC